MALPIRTPWRLGLLAGGIGYLGGAAALSAAILRSTSSTAAIGFLFIPFVALVPGALSFAAGTSAAILWQSWRAPTRRWSFAPLASAFTLLVVLGGSGFFLAKNLRVMHAVDAALAMDVPQLSAYFARGHLRRDAFVLGAIAQNPAADAELLDGIARLEDDSLHTAMGSLFPLLGENRKGLAVMRLVARHANVEEPTLVWLSRSPDDYVLGDVAANRKTPVDVLTRLHGRGDYLIEWGLARNPRTPPAILQQLSSSSNEYTRSSVATNPGANPVDLERLARDPLWHVRRGVAANRVVAREVLEPLARDDDERVARAARQRLTNGDPGPH